ncbi:MAG: hypothetical protein QOH03_5488, partial [Kribbellaceae bacterium]|nr:hypothetical protein [Kribbellaceae bacterium]
MRANMQGTHRTITLSLVAIILLGAPLLFHRASKGGALSASLTPRAENALPISPLSSAPPSDRKPDAAIKARAGDIYGKLPMTFESNAGQTDERVNFLARGAGYSLFLTPTESVFVMSRRRGKPEEGEALTAKNDATSARAEAAAPASARAEETTLRMRLVGANSLATAEGADELAGKVNYFIGNDPRKWHANVSTYGRVRYAGVYRGVDVVYYGNGRQLEYDFVLAPGADSRQISLAFGGVEKVEVEAASGDLLLHTPLGVMRQHQPRAYQEVGGGRHEIASRYVKRAGGEIGFDVADYDATQPLVIDPVLVYSTFLGGNGQDFATGIAV